MPKRQDACKPSLSEILNRLTVISLVILITACQPAPSTHTPESQTPTASALGTLAAQQPTSTPALSPSHTPTNISTATQAPTNTPTPTPDCRLTGGSLQQASYYSQYLKRDYHYFIYLPPCYSSPPQAGFPVLYLLHGQSYTNDQWLRLGLVDRMDALIAQGVIAPFIIVLPQEVPIQPPQISSFPEILTEELIPWVDGHYATLTEKEFRGIGGISRGAAWAVHIGFEHIALFGSIGAHSLPLFLADGGKIQGWLNQAPLEDMPRVFVDIGRNDREWKTAQNFANLLDEFHIPHEWYLFNDGHTEAYWSSHLDLYLQWYAKNW